MDRKEFGAALRAAREAAGLTQADLAARVLMANKQPISDVERGRTNPSVERLDALLRGCGMRLAVLPVAEAEGDEEARLLDAFRACDPVERDVLLETALRLSQRKG